VDQAHFVGFVLFVSYFQQDLNTVKKKLLKNKYASKDEFATEMKLIWSNAILFNEVCANRLSLLLQCLVIFSPLRDGWGDWCLIQVQQLKYGEIVGALGVLYKLNS
jgi:hypothetical protein